MAGQSRLVIRWPPQASGLLLRLRASCSVRRIGTALRPHALEAAKASRCFSRILAKTAVASAGRRTVNLVAEINLERRPVERFLVDRPRMKKAQLGVA